MTTPQDIQRMEAFGMEVPVDPKIAVTNELRVCCCSVTLVESIIEDDVDTMDDLSQISDNNIHSLARTITTLPVSRGGTKFGITKVKKVQALCAWLRQRHAEGLLLDSNEWTEAALSAQLDEQALKAASGQIKDEAVELPENFQPIKWVAWRKLP